METLRCVFDLRLITAADVTATFAQAQMHPCVTLLQTVFAAPRARRDVFDLIGVRTIGSHVFLLLTPRLTSDASVSLELVNGIRHPHEHLLPKFAVRGKALLVACLSL